MEFFSLFFFFFFFFFLFFFFFFFYYTVNHYLELFVKMMMCEIFLTATNWGLQVFGEYELL